MSCISQFQSAELTDAKAFIVVCRKLSHGLWTCDLASCASFGHLRPLHPTKTESTLASLTQSLWLSYSLFHRDHTWVSKIWNWEFESFGRNEDSFVLRPVVLTLTFRTPLTAIILDTTMTVFIHFIDMCLLLMFISKLAHWELGSVIFIILKYSSNGSNPFEVDKVIDLDIILVVFLTRIIFVIRFSSEEGRRIIKWLISRDKWAETSRMFDCEGRNLAEIASYTSLNTLSLASIIFGRAINFSFLSTLLCRQIWPNWYTRLPFRWLD